MGLPEGGWPTRYEVLPAKAEQIIDRVTEVAGRFGRFILKTPTVHLHMSEHFDYERHGAQAMLDRQLYEPRDGEAAMSKEQTAAHYVAMAREAAENE